MTDRQRDDRSPMREGYLRATAEACGLSPDAAVAYLDQMLARNRDARHRVDLGPLGNLLRDHFPRSTPWNREQAQAAIEALFAEAGRSLDPPDCLRCNTPIDTYDRACCHVDDCGACGPCAHDWTLRPESDTHVCEICGAER